MKNALLQGMLNDLKRRPVDAARDLQLPLAELEAMLDGTVPVPFDVIQRACQVWPVNARDFFSKNDDAPRGVKIMDAESSRCTRRVMERGGQPYYEYRDTAMSSVAPFRPEWIAELCTVTDIDPENPLVQWNNGHFMHQFTYFIGPVNFYFRAADGKKAVAPMDTGDSMYISPYTPHTFTTRRDGSGRSGLILALTYGDKIAAEPKHELGALGDELARAHFLDFSSRSKCFSALLTFYMEALALGPTTLATGAGLPERVVSELLAASRMPSTEEVSKLAVALRVSARDLLPLDAIPNRVVIQRGAEARRWGWPEQHPAYYVHELAGTLALPNSKALRVVVQSEGSTPLWSCGLHQYCYNTGDSSVSLTWQLGGQSYTEQLEPGASAYVKPFVQHQFAGNGELIVLRVGGNLGAEVVRDLSAIGHEHASRVARDSLPWFNPQGAR